jgi:transposase
MRSNSNSGSVEAAIASGPAKRRYRSKIERRRIVEETLLPGASVAVIARSHGVNANQVFNWRKMYHDGRLDVQPSATRFLPARIINSSHDERPSTGTLPPGAYSGAIDIEIGDVRVRITGSADPGCLRAALEQLHR